MSSRSLVHARTSLLLGLLTAALLTVSASPAAARVNRITAQPANGPQFGSFGQYGEAFRAGGFDATAYDNGKYDKALTPGRFIDPVGFAVDTHDTTAGGDGTAIYVLDRISNLPGNVTGATTSWRLQKLNDTGGVLGTDQFSLPTSLATDPGIFESLGLTVDPATGNVYALVVGYDANTGQTVGDEIIGWSTTPSAGKLVGSTGLAPSPMAVGIAGFPTPGVLSTAAQLSATTANPAVQDPQGLALDVVGTTDFVAVQGLDTTSPPTGQNGIIQICASTPCGTLGNVTHRWSSSVLTAPQFGTDQGEFPAGISTAADGSLVVSLNNGAGGAPGPDNTDVVNVPANLTSTPTNLESIANTLNFPGEVGSDPDNSAISTSGASVEQTNPDGLTVATQLAGPPVVDLSNGLYAAEFETAPAGSPDPQNPSGANSLWTSTSPGVRLLSPAAEPDRSISNIDPPLLSLVDTLGNPVLNTTGTPTPSSACNLSDSVATNTNPPAGTFPSLAAGANGSVWVLTKGVDSSTAGGDFNGGRQLIELAPNAANACPSPSGTFTIAAGGGAPQPATSQFTVTAGTTVNFNASTIAYPGPTTAPQGARSEYLWDFGNGQTAAVQVDPNTFFWPTPQASTVYTKTGVFPVTLKVYGDYGVYLETGTINVTPATPPTAVIAPISGATAGTPVSFDASQSTPSPGATLIDWIWNFGDGSNTDDTPTDTHTYANPGTYTVTLTIHDNNNGTATTTQNVTVSPAPPPPTTTTTTTTTPPPTTTTTSTTPAPPPPPPPAVTANFASKTSPAGSESIVVSCPAGQQSCSGTVTLKTAKAVATSAARRHKKPHKAILTLGTARFTISGGQSHTIQITLRGKALSLLKKSHSLRAIATIDAANPQGETTHKTETVTLRYPATKPKHHKKKKKK